jgi:hypothetical protein
MKVQLTNTINYKNIMNLHQCNLNYDATIEKHPEHKNQHKLIHNSPIKMPI